MSVARPEKIMAVNTKMFFIHCLGRANRSSAPGLVMVGIDTIDQSERGEPRFGHKIVEAMARWPSGTFFAL